MNLAQTNKKKIINDPVYGFINISSELMFDLIEHPIFQRLRRIRQLGFTNYVYPAANHTRFQHALGAVYLMGTAIEVLKSKGLEITDEEAEGVKIAILLHDIGHGPFSHALENSIIQDIPHELLSELLMNELNELYHGQLSLAIRIFKNQYPKQFLHQLVSSQLDMDRLDYLKRDSFFTGVYEGIIGSDRIIKMLTVKNDQLVVEAKGIYSIEKFLVARRLMYWQVYLHKTVLSAEKLIVNILRRARELAQQGQRLFATPDFEFFLYHQIGRESLLNPNERTQILSHFVGLDDNDIVVSAKVWAKHPDPILSQLCQWLIYRKFYKIELQNEPFELDRVAQYTRLAVENIGVDEKDARFFVFTDNISNLAYEPKDENIKILFNDGKLVDIAEASDMLNVSMLSKTVKKHFMCYPRTEQFKQLTNLYHKNKYTS